jgi:mannosyl-oligosaccharide alpha-1,2-mannosidase
MLRLTLLALWAIVASALPSNTAPILSEVKRQYYDPPPLPTTDTRAQAVVEVFRTSWNGYYTYAFPMDELRPVNNSGSNSRYVNMSISKRQLPVIIRSCTTNNLLS